MQQIAVKSHGVIGFVALRGKVGRSGGLLLAVVEVLIMVQKLVNSARRHRFTVHNVVRA